MGAPKTPIRGARPPSHVAYYVALAGCIVLLVLLCCYFLYFLIKRVKELATQEYSTQPAQSSQPRPPPAPASYPVQPVVRDSASAMAKLCRQLPAPSAGTVFPASDSAPPLAPTSPGPVVSKLPAPVIIATANEVPTVP